MNHKTKKLGLSQINKIKRLANKRGTPLIEVTFGKKSIRFLYKSSQGTGVIGLLYPNREQGIERELKRLEKSTE